MSTMYYINDTQEALGQTHSLGKDRGYHFTWCICPLDFAKFYHNFLSVAAPVVADEYGNGLSLLAFIDIVQRASSVSFDERIAD